ncbi:transporter substrate-binding domain-containing protein [Candidatus Accumulibacter sp. ACC003]|uniref:substrate-binding periplasmic protein n=1 Tax=Candidatus Accumulibacter sp. ACC003 TaxID=2823334 RepID=UPI0025B932E2|nr:transporter substrate-binding domain-containing protein [Candidatus Accumulibacter sp. ACC003]
MARTLRALCCAAAIWAGGANALELHVAIARSTVLQAPGEAPAKSSRVSLLVDFNLAVARETCRRISARCVFSYPDFAAIIPGIESRLFQLGFGSYLRTPEREARVAFSDALWRSSSRLLAFTPVAARFAAPAGGELTVEKLRDARVVSISDSQQYAYLQSVAASQNLQVVGRSTTSACLEALYGEQADFALLSVLGAFLALDPTASRTPSFIGPGTVAHGLGGSVHIALPRDDEKLRQTVNAALAAMHRDGSYQRLWRRYFPYDFY